MVNRVQKQIIKEALDRDDLLDEWEAGFISDMAEKSDDYPVSPGQNTILNRIGNRIAQS